MVFTVFTIVILAMLLAGVWMYNQLVRNHNLVNEAWSGIDVQLQKRHELVPNLVTTVKGYVSHESGVFEEVTRIRGDRNASVPELAKQESALSRSLGKLFVLAEDYLDLKASEGFQQLHSSLVDIEDHLQFARRYYNGAVRDNNNLVESFPSNLVARTFKFSIAEFFEIEFASKRAAPDVDL